MHISKLLDFKNYFLKSLNRASKDIDLHKLHRTSPQCKSVTNIMGVRCIAVRPPQIFKFNNYKDVICNAVVQYNVEKGQFL